MKRETQLKMGNNNENTATKSGSFEPNPNNNNTGPVSLKRIVIYCRNMVTTDVKLLQFCANNTYTIVLPIEQWLCHWHQLGLRL